MIDYKQDMGHLSKINQNIIEIKGFSDHVKLNHMVLVEESNLLGEIIQIHDDYIVAQCFERTKGLKLGDIVKYLNEPLSMELGPGLLGNLFDGLQRPLKKYFKGENSSYFLEIEEMIPALDRDIKWHFNPVVSIGDKVSYGDVIGIVKETPLMDHKIMVSHKLAGKISKIAEEGDYTVDETIYTISTDNGEYSFSMLQKGTILEPGPYKKGVKTEETLITGVDVIDLLFPAIKGGTVAVPGGFGTGKTIIQHSLAKFCDADVIIFVGCGERGNEIADVLDQFEDLIDPKTNRPLIERLILIANTSNMPIAAREASIFSGITLAEYYRDMGYKVALLADSLSRWAESLREISGLLEEMPAEEGYPAYLPSKLSSFYEREGNVLTWGNDINGDHKDGSLTIIGSVSPPSGDFSEPVTSNIKRFVNTFWALDPTLAYAKHYPAINWYNSYSQYLANIKDWWRTHDVRWPEIEIDWYECRNIVNQILSIDHDLQNIVRLVGESNLPDNQQLDILVARLIKDSFLVQNAFDPIDCFTSPEKMIAHIKLIILLYNQASSLLEQGFIAEDIRKMEIVPKLRKIAQDIPNEDINQMEKLKDKLMREFLSYKLLFGERNK